WNPGRGIWIEVRVPGFLCAASGLRVLAAEAAPTKYVALAAARLGEGRRQRVVRRRRRRLRRACIAPLAARAAPAAVVARPAFTRRVVQPPRQRDALAGDVDLQHFHLDDV